jgi:hypothetical protein
MNRWVLAFDASCGCCRAISHAVAQASGGALEVLPLSNPDVRRWRERSLGSSAPWTPTLIEVAGTDVTAWTGPSLALRLVGHLGARSSMRVLAALGRSRSREKRRGVRPLHWVAGLGILASLIMTKISRRGAE